jgi:hypothetical protein
MGLSFTIAAGPRQRSHPQIRVPRDLWPCSAVSDSRFLQPGGLSPRICMHQEQGGPVIPPGTGFYFRCLLRLVLSLSLSRNESWSRYTASARTAQNTSLPLLRVLSLLGKQHATKLFPSNGCFTFACLHSCYLAMGLHVTICLCCSTCHIFAAKFCLFVIYFRRCQNFRQCSVDVGFTGE